MKPELIEHANHIAADAHRSSNHRGSILDAVDVAELAWELISGALDLVIGLLG
jgi:hypothetical protein